jgi:hypothetical protein
MTEQTLREAREFIEYTHTSGRVVSPDWPRWKAVIAKIDAALQAAEPVGYASRTAIRNMQLGIQPAAAIVPKAAAVDDGDDVPVYLAAAPAVQPAEPLSALVATWRHAATHLGLDGLASLADCADELEAALAQPAAQPVAFHDKDRVLWQPGYLESVSSFPAALYAAPQPAEPTDDEDFISALDSAGIQVDPGLAFEIKAIVERLAEPKPTTATNEGAMNFAAYMVDKCERETVTEEAILRWLADFLVTPRYAALAAQPVEPVAVQLADSIFDNIVAGWNEPESAAPAATVPAPSGETEAQRIEVTAAWNDLPDALRAHPGLKRLYRALGGISRDGVKEGGKC